MLSAFPYCVDKAHTEKMAREIGVSPAGLRHLFCTMCQSLPKLAEDLAAELECPVGHAIADLIHTRADKLLTQLACR